MAPPLPTSATAEHAQVKLKTQLISVSVCFRNFVMVAGDSRTFLHCNVGKFILATKYNWLLIVPQHHRLLQRSRSFWQVALHDSRHLSQQMGILCSSLTNTLTCPMTRNAWLSGSETNLVSTRRFVLHSKHLH